MGDLTNATSPHELRQLHGRYVEGALAHCLLDPAGQPAATLINGVLALALALRHEVCEGREGHGGDEISTTEDGSVAIDSTAGTFARDDGAEDARNWLLLVSASQNQFTMLLRALAREPLAPPVLVEGHHHTS